MLVEWMDGVRQTQHDARNSAVRSNGTGAPQIKRYYEERRHKEEGTGAALDGWSTEQTIQLMGLELSRNTGREGDARQTASA